MALESNFSNLSDNGFGSGSEQGGLSGIRFGTIVDDIVSGDPVFPEHVVRLYQVLSADTVDAEVGIDGLVAAQNVKVNEKLLTDDLEIEGNFTLSGGLTVPGNLTVEGNVSVEGDFEFSDPSSNFGSNATEAIENAFNDGSDATFTFSGGQIDVSLNNDTVNDDELDAVNSSGFLQRGQGLGNGFTFLEYTGINLSSEFNGDGTDTSQISIANDAITNAELNDMPGGSIKVGDGGDPYNLQLGDNAVPVSTTEAGGTNIVAANINSKEVLGRGSSGGVTALDIENDLKGLLELDAGDINAGTFNQAGQRFSFDDRLDMLGGALVSGNAKIEFREGGNDAVIDFNTGSNKELKIESGAVFINSTDSNISISADNEVNINALIVDIDADSEIQLDADNDLSIESTSGTVSIIADEDLRLESSDHIVLEGDTFSDAEVNQKSGGNQDPRGTINLGPGLRIETYDLTTGGTTSFLIFAEEGSADYRNEGSAQLDLSDSFIKDVIGENEAALYHVIEGSGGGGGSEDSRIRYIERQPNDGGTQEKTLID